MATLLVHHQWQPARPREAEARNERQQYAHMFAHLGDQHTAHDDVGKRTRGLCYESVWLEFALGVQRILTYFEFVISVMQDFA